MKNRTEPDAKEPTGVDKYKNKLIKYWQLSEFNGPWLAMVNHGSPLLTIVKHDQPWLAMANHGYLL